LQNQCPASPEEQKNRTVKWEKKFQKTERTESKHLTSHQEIQELFKSVENIGKWDKIGISTSYTYSCAIQIKILNGADRTGMSN